MTEYFVATDGKSNGSGKINDPIDFLTMTDKILLPSDRLFIREGTYKSLIDWNINRWNGSVNNPVIIKPYNNEFVKFDGGIRFLGTYFEWRDFEHFSTAWTTRITDIAGSNPADITAPFSFILGGSNCKIINCIIHDGKQGIWDPQKGSEISDCIFFNQGWLGPDRGHGHSVYIRNQGDTQLIKNNIFAQGFSGWGLHAYGAGPNLIDNLRVENNISIDNIMLAQATNQPMDNTHFENNEVFNANIQIGHPDTISTNVVAKDNYVGMGNLILQNCIDPIDEGNVATNSSGGNRIITIKMGNKLALAIFNWENLTSVKVDLYDKGLRSGFRYRARNAQNYFGDYFFFTYDETYYAGSQAIEFPMTGHNVAIPYMHNEALVESSFPDFGCFIIEEVGRDFHGRQEISPWTN